MPENQSIPKPTEQPKSTVANPEVAKSNVITVEAKPKVRYDKEIYQQNENKLIGIKQRFKDITSIDDAKSLVTEGQGIEASMRDMLDAAHDEALEQNAGIDARKAEEQKTLDKLKGGNFSFAEMSALISKKEEPVQQAEATDKVQKTEGIKTENPTISPEEQKDEMIEQLTTDELKELDTNIQEVSKEVQEAGGAEELKRAIDELPEDQKSELTNKLGAEYAKMMTERKRKYEETKDNLKISALITTPAPAFILASDTGDGSKLAAVGFGALYLTGATIPAGTLGTVYFGVKAIGEKIGMKLAERRHRKELKKLEKTS